MPQPAHEYDDSPTFITFACVLLILRSYSNLVNDDSNFDDEVLTGSFWDAKRVMSYDQIRRDGIR